MKMASSVYVRLSVRMYPVTIGNVRITYHCATFV